MGRYNGHGPSKVYLKGKVNGKPKTFEYEVNFSKINSSHEYIAPLWAARCVGHLLDQVRLNGQNQELIDEIVRLSKQHGIITPYTSYLIIEDESHMLSQNQIRQEDQLLRNRIVPTAPSSGISAPATESVEEELADSYQSMAKKESEKSVRASQEIQRLNNATNMEQTQVGQSRMAYRDDLGQVQNLSNNIRNVQGRAFYENNNQWVDSRIQQNTTPNINWERIAFNSKAYFDLIANNPEAIAYLNLGRNVRFNLGERWIEVYE